MHRSIDRGPRMVTLFMVFLLCGWMLVRLAKWALLDTIVATRYLWYSYYIFQLLLPLLFLTFAWMIDRPEAHKPARWLLAWYAVNGCLIALVLTNDLHQWVFRFPLGLNALDDYKYGIGFWIVTLGWILPLLAALVMLFIKSARCPRRYGRWVPILLCGSLFLYTYAYVSRHPLAMQSDLVVVLGFFAIIFFESMLQFGLIPVNTKYKMLFAHSPLRIAILDRQKSCIMSSRNSLDFHKLHLEAALAAYPMPVISQADTLMYAAPIAGGTAVWQEDISEVNQLHCEVALSVKRLAATTHMLEEEARLRQQREEEHAHQRVTLQLEAEIASQTERFSSMVAQLPQTEARMKERVNCVLLLCYIKRRCQLFFLTQEAPTMASAHLIGYFDELASLAVYGKLHINLTHAVDEAIPVEHARLLYDFYYVVVEAAIRQNCTYMPSTFMAQDGVLPLRFLVENEMHAFTLDTAFTERMRALGAEYTRKDLDEMVGLSLVLHKRGASDA